MNAIRTFLHDEDGITAIEYALMAAGIAAVVAAAAVTLGDKISTSLGKINTLLT